MTFRRLLELVSGTCTCRAACETSARALLIDPVVDSVDRLPCVDIA
jgi:hypothetical protein